jgi:hypothetical protein
MSNDETNKEVALDFDPWSDLSARMNGLELEARMDLLDEHDVAIEDWDKADKKYALLIAEDIAAGRMERARAYAAKCAAELASRKEPERAQESATPPADIPVQPFVGAPLEAPVPEVPSFLRHGSTDRRP